MAMRDMTAAMVPEQGTSRVRRWTAVGALMAASVAAGVSVHAQGMGGPGPGPHGGGPDMMMLGGPPQHIARGIDHLLDGLSATDAQRAQIKQIALAAAADLKAQREAGRGLHVKGMAIFAAANVDAAAAESLRQQMLAQHDQSSKRLLQAMLDISKVLTPEQRAKLGERMQQREVAMKERMEREQREHRDRPPQK
jgi:Spy/CpxP family protein refolding chaperone